VTVESSITSEWPSNGERKAEAFPDTEEKKYFKELARQWRELAKRAERAGEQPSNKPSGCYEQELPHDGWKEIGRSSLAGSCARI
jgi:hypothetical protein